MKLMICPRLLELDLADINKTEIYLSFDQNLQTDLHLIQLLYNMSFELSSRFVHN